MINIDAGLHYLSDLYYDHFQDWGFAVQAYHAGPRRVKQGISTYIKSRKRKSIRWYRIGPETIKNENASWIKMMRTRPSFRFFQFLRDESEYYLPKALACFRIYLGRGEIFR